MKTKKKPATPVRVQPVVGWLWWGIRIGVRIGLMVSFAVDMLIFIGKGQCWDALIAGVIAVVLCPAWDQPANS